MKIRYIILIMIIALFIILYLIRAFSPRELDDVSPGIPCEKNLLEKADILWVIPEYKNRPISGNMTWCQEILSLNKTIGMHGVRHEYNEFLSNRNEQYLQEGIKIFEGCFNFTPRIFKPPQLVISKNSKVMIRESGLERKSYFNQITHKVYHCNDTEPISNKWLDIL